MQIAKVKVAGSPASIQIASFSELMLVVKVLKYKINWLHLYSKFFFFFKQIKSWKKVCNFTNKHLRSRPINQRTKFYYNWLIKFSASWVYRSRHKSPGKFAKCEKTKTPVYKTLDFISLYRKNIYIICVRNGRHSCRYTLNNVFRST